MTTHARQRLHSEAKIPVKTAMTQNIRIPVGNGDYVSLPAGKTTKPQFIDAIKDALKARFRRQCDLDRFVWNLFHGEFAVTGNLDEHERWYIIEVVCTNNKVKQRLFGEL